MIILNCFICFLSFWSGIIKDDSLCTKESSLLHEKCCHDLKEEISNNTITLDSLKINNVQIDNVLLQITEELSNKISIFYVRLFIKNEKDIKILVTGDVYTDYIFSERKYGDVYGYLQLNERIFFIVEYPIIEKTEQVGFFQKTDKIKIFEKYEIPQGSYRIKLENPEWLYQYKKGELKLIKTVNTEYFLPKKK